MERNENRMDIILASKSPRRRALLEQMGVRDFRIVTPDIDEHMDRDLPPAELVAAISRLVAVKSVKGEAEPGKPFGEGDEHDHREIGAVHDGLRNILDVAAEFKEFARDLGDDAGAVLSYDRNYGFHKPSE